MIDAIGLCLTGGGRMEICARVRDILSGLINHRVKAYKKSRKTHIRGYRTNKKNKEKIVEIKKVFCGLCVNSKEIYGSNERVCIFTGHKTDINNKNNDCKSYKQKSTTSIIGY